MKTSYCLIKGERFPAERAFCALCDVEMGVGAGAALVKWMLANIT